MRGERVRHTRRYHQQIASLGGDDVVLDEQVERVVEDVEQLGGMVVPVRHRPIGATHPPTGPAQALLDIRHGQAANGER